MHTCPRALLATAGLLLGAVACAAFAPFTGTPISAETTAHSWVLTGPQPPLEWYGGPLPNAAGATPSALNGPLGNAIAALVTSLGADAGRVPLHRDPRLNAAAALLTHATRGDTPPPTKATTFALQQYGVVESDVQLVVAHIPDGANDDLSPLEEPLSRAMGGQPATHFGIAVRHAPDDGNILVVLLQNVVMRIEPFPRQLPPDGSALLRFRPEPAYHAPRVLVTQPDGNTATLQSQRQGDDEGFEARIGCNGVRGVYRVEVLLNGPAGPVIGGNFPLWCDTEPPAALHLDMGSDAARHHTDPRDIERTLLTLIADARANAGVPPLSVDATAARVARKHSEDMRANGFVAHVSPQTGDVGDRMARANLDFAFVSENVGFGSSAVDIHEGLMQSPAHRKAIVDATALRVGVGVAVAVDPASGIPRIYTTEIFWTPVAHPGH